MATTNNLSLKDQVQEQFIWNQNISYKLHYCLERNGQGKHKQVVIFFVFLTQNGLDKGLFILNLANILYKRKTVGTEYNDVEKM